ncbi:MAG: hypothetical protein LBP22_13925 [Deltaproteobacteria bacterium]|nr:hypothetical protein [Deltaproteobacteria bacterium]
MRGGVRLIWAVSEYVSPHIGLPYERELVGQIRATTSGLPIDEPSFKGGTSLGEIDLSVTAPIL